MESRVVAEFSTCPSCDTVPPPGTQWCRVCRAHLSDPAAGRLVPPAKRLAAGVLDGFVPFGAFIYSGAVARDELETILGLAAVAAYMIWSLALFATGRTPGKLLLGTRVLGENRAGAGFVRMLFREWMAKPFSGMFLLLGHIWILFDRDKQGWHDKLMSTFVVETPPLAGVADGAASAARDRLAIRLGAVGAVVTAAAVLVVGRSLFPGDTVQGGGAAAGRDEPATLGREGPATPDRVASGSGGGPFDDADDHSCVRGRETPLAVGSSAGGTLAAGDEDCFAVSIPTGASGGGITVWTGGETDTYGFLYDRDYAVLDENDDFDEDLNFLVSAAGTSGPYYVRVRGYDEATAGDYVVQAVAGSLVALAPEEYGPWLGDWYDESVTDLEDNVYFRLGISNAHEYGFEYLFEERSVPYGPNAIWSEERSARFVGPGRALDLVTGQVFVLSIDPADRHARVLDVLEGRPGQLEWSADMGDGIVNGQFVFERSVYRAGFDCDDATTAVETTICRNELLALGDLEMNGLYRELIENAAAERAQSLQVGQRAFLAQRDGDCVENGDVDEGCVARLYADRLVSLRRSQDPSLGSRPRFDADYARGLLQRGVDLRRNTDARLAMYPLEMKVGETGETVDWRSDESGLLYEQTYTNTRPMWPADTDIRYSDMFFVGAGGAVISAAHMAPADSAWAPESLPEEQRLSRLESAAGRDVLTIWRETEDALPDLVRAWLDRHPYPVSPEP